MIQIFLWPAVLPVEVTRHLKRSSSSNTTAQNFKIRRTKDSRIKPLRLRLLEHSCKNLDQTAKAFAACRQAGVRISPLQGCSNDEEAASLRRWQAYFYAEMFE